MLKNKFTITISDIKGSRHITLNQVIKKVVFYSVLFIVLIILIGGGVIFFLTQEVSKIEVKREAMAKDMNEKSMQLQNKLDEQIAYYKVVQAKIDEVESAIGIKDSESNETAMDDIDIRLEKLTLTTAQRVMILDFIPNGEVILEHRGITDKFGMRTHPISQTRELHAGLDYGANLKTPVYAPAHGVVEFVGVSGGYGNLVIIDHGFGFKTYYAHLDKGAVVKYGQFVARGDHIANSGNSGLSTGPHLHYEVRFLGRPLDPANFIKWNSTNFEDIFEKEKRIPWGSLLKASAQMINKTQKLQ
ncbi:MAG: peptidoglycan DD-metalloendopeptidase family protein [Campylobacteraceae bacterium]